MENSLDAAESIGVLPLVSLSVEEFTEAEFNQYRGMENRDVVDTGLFKVSKSPFQSRTAYYSGIHQATTSAQLL